MLIASGMLNPDSAFGPGLNCANFRIIKIKFLSSQRVTTPESVSALRKAAIFAKVVIIAHWSSPCKIWAELNVWT
jgi:hypothetical protein